MRAGKEGGGWGQASPHVLASCTGLKIGSWNTKLDRGRSKGKERGVAGGAYLWVVGHSTRTPAGDHGVADLFHAPRGLILVRLTLAALVAGLFGHDGLFPAR
jgi:hypothetical protein